MIEPGTFTIEIRQPGAGHYLIGDWPQYALFADDLMDQVAGVKHRLGDDFRINVENGHAVFRWIETRPHGFRLCQLIESSVLE